jgi:hypothetical protein
VYPHFVHIFDNVSLFAAELEELKIGMSGKGLNFLLVKGPFYIMILSIIKHQRYGKKVS